MSKQVSSVERPGATRPGDLLQKLNYIESEFSQIHDALDVFIQACDPLFVAGKQRGAGCASLGHMVLGKMNAACERMEIIRREAWGADVQPVQPPCPREVQAVDIDSPDFLETLALNVGEEMKVQITNPICLPVWDWTALVRTAKQKQGTRIDLLDHALWMGLSALSDYGGNTTEAENMHNDIRAGIAAREGAVAK